MKHFSPTENDTHRRILWVALYEGISIFLATAALVILGNDITKSLPTTVTSTIIATVWYPLFNTVFEKTEDRYRIRRTPLIRLVHSLLAQGGMFLMGSAAMSVILGIPLLTAYQISVAFTTCYFIYSLIFTYVFDRLVPRRSWKIQSTPQF